MGRAVVVGASMAGLLTARVLSEHVAEVVVVERDELAGDVATRRGVPQGRHAHAILAGGMELIEGWFPGTTAELVARGAYHGDGGLGHWYQGGADKWYGELGLTGVSASRPLLEETVRRRLLALPNVTIESGRRVTGLRLGRTGVSGAAVDGTMLGADLVVDCSGRSSRLLDELQAGGYDAPPVSQVVVDVSYGTRLLRRTDHDMAGWFAVVAPDPPATTRAAVLLPIEGDRWILTLAGMHGDVVPSDDHGYLEFARSLPSPVIAGVLERADLLSPVMTHRFPSSQRRHFERLGRVPAGFVAVGDAVCSFNPIYGQGMSSAAQQAAELGRLVARHGPASPLLPEAFYRRAAKVVANPWTIAVGADLLHPATTGPKPKGTDLVNRYIRRAHLACHTSPEVWRAMLRVQSLLEPPSALLRPRLMARVFAAARRSPAARAGMPAPLERELAPVG